MTYPQQGRTGTSARGDKGSVPNVLIRGGIMRNKACLALVCVCFFLLSVSGAYGKDKTPKDLMGQMTLNLNMISTEDRILDYGKEYYGTYYLIITFFPAAYTPV
jgi:hypothetical protein